MGGYYDEIEIEDMTWDEEARVYHYPCPCGDRFEISKAQLAECEDIATCPSCSLIIRVIFDPLDYEDYEEEQEEDIDTSSAEDSFESKEYSDASDNQHVPSAITAQSNGKDEISRAIDALKIGDDDVAPDQISTAESDKDPTVSNSPRPAGDGGIQAPITGTAQKTTTVTPAVDVH